jgi:membrane protein DedA with SNARE-associated domain
MHHFLTLWFDWVQQWGYLGVILLMAMESSITPVPSEIVIAPAAYMATLPGSHMTVWGVILAGTFGSWLGAAITYWVSRWLGRVIVVKFGGYLMISEKKLEMAEHWVHRYEAGGIFFARLLPMVRHLISIPAGIIRMGFGDFSVMTIAGSASWCTVLAIYGQRVLGDYAKVHPDWMQHPAGVVAFMKSQSHWIIGAILVFCILYFLVLKLTAKPAKPVPAAARQ